MPTFSTASLDKLSTCHKDLQILFNEVIKYVDCTVIEGFRDKDAQNKAFAEGKSQRQWPDGNHNQLPSYAVDVAPYPIDFKDVKRFYFFGGIVMGLAVKLKQEGLMEHDVRFGGDWNRDYDVKDNNFNDLFHYELVK